MSEWISFDTLSIEELDLEWREKNYKKVIQFLTKKYQNLIQSIGELDFQSRDILELHRTHSNFFLEASDIDDKRLSNYSNTVNILDDELKLYLLKNNYSSKEDFIKKKFSKEFVLFEKFLEMIELCHDYEKEAKKSLGYLMRIISTAASINPEFGLYIYKDIVQNYLSKLSYFEKKKIEEKRQANEADLGFFGPKDILDVIDSYTNILEYQELEIDDKTAESIYTASAEYSQRNEPLMPYFRATSDGFQSHLRKQESHYLTVVTFLTYS